MVGARRLEEIQAEAKYHRQRFDLYKAKSYGSHPTSEARMRELERRSRGADSRLREARQENARAADPGY